MKRSAFAIVAVAVSFVTLGAQSTPRSAADELLAADRAFAAAAAKTDLTTAITAMFAPDVALTYAGGIAYGSAKAAEALKSNAANTGARIEWTPLRVSVSGDGRHGFTAGVMTWHRADGTTTPLKYLAYWEKQAAGWRVLAYKRGVAKAAPVSLPQVSFVLPRHSNPSATDAAAIERYRESLAETERNFSRDAQKIGIGPAFKQYGDPEALNLGGPDTPTFILRNEEIAQNVGSGSGTDSPVNWGPEKTFVAASGDFGVTVGYIVQNKPGADGKIPPGNPFFTIWRRDSPKDPWRYIAE